MNPKSSCLSCIHIGTCGAVRRNRFNTAKEMRDFLKSFSDDCKDYEKREREVRREKKHTDS